jgi:O-antigen ligase
VLPLAVATGILSAFALLSAALMATGGAGSWQWLLIALFVVLALVAGALTYRAWRRPYARV